MVTSVPWVHAGRGRSVYPGFLQLSGFMTMNLDRHIRAHKDLFLHLVRGDGDSALKHKEFYDEYLAVMDLAAEFFLQTVDTVFVRHALPKGEMTHRGQPIDARAIRRVALMTIEGEKDDITGVGQCHAAHALCGSLDTTKRRHREQMGVGHYGIFNGSRFSAEILPDMLDFIQQNDRRAAAMPSARAGPAGAAKPADTGATDDHIECFRNSAKRFSDKRHDKQVRPARNQPRKNYGP